MTRFAVLCLTLLLAWPALAQYGPSPVSGASSVVPATIAASGTAQTLTFNADGSNSTYNITKTGNVVLTVTGGATGHDQTMKIVVYPGAGGFSESFTSSPAIKWSGGTTPTASTTAQDVYWVSTTDGGATYIGWY